MFGTTSFLIRLTLRGPRAPGRGKAPRGGADRIVVIDTLKGPNVGERFKSGDRVLEDGVYIFDGFVSSTTAPQPKEHERKIDGKKGQSFPMIAGQAVWWQKKRP